MCWYSPVDGPTWVGWNSLVARFMGPTWGQSGADRIQVGPMLALWTLLYGLKRHALDFTHYRELHPVSISEKTCYRKISWSLEAARSVVRIVRSLWNLTGASAALLPMCLSNFKAIRQFKVPISWLRDFTRSYDKTYFRILRRGPGVSNTSSWWNTSLHCGCPILCLCFHITAGI